MCSVIDKLKIVFKADLAAGIVLIMSLALTLGIANSPLNAGYQTILRLSALSPIVNNGLMTFFFLSLALEIKYERVAGELLNPKQVLLPIVAACGGVLAPAFIYLFFVGIQDPLLLRGWAIPIATDVALALGLMSLLGKRIPPSLKIFLTVLAIADDFIAILVIAVFYTVHVSCLYLTLALIGVALLLRLNQLNVSLVSGYLFVGAFIWFALLKSGIHPTLAGVAVGFCIPHRHKNNCAVSPLLSLGTKLHVWVKFFILPLFVLSNAGIPLIADKIGLLHALPLGIALGLFLGKQLGIFTAVWLLVKFNLAPLPANSNWIQVYGIAVLAGIGFTMSLFISDLAFVGTNFTVVSCYGIFLGSALAAVFGLLILYGANKKAPC